MERELLGLYLSGHPLDDYDELLAGEGIDRLMELAESADGSKTIVAGMVVSVKTITTKQGKAMAFMELEDQIERCEVVLFPEVWRRSGEFVAKGALLALRATVQQQDEGFKLLADELAPLSAASLAQLRRSRGASPRGAGGASAQPKPAARREGDAAMAASPRTAAAQRSEAPGAAPYRPQPEARAAAPEAGARIAKTPAQRVFIKITAAAENARLLEKLKQLLQLHPGPMSTVLYYESTGKLLALNERYSIKPSPELFQQMEDMLGSGTVKVK
ncbi:DNA polymerase III subunit alpha [compost metagenome]